jgi:hypothetical protein
VLAVDSLGQYISRVPLELNTRRVVLLKGLFNGHQDNCGISSTPDDGPTTRHKRHETAMSKLKVSRENEGSCELGLQTLDLNSVEKRYPMSPNWYAELSNPKGTPATAIKSHRIRCRTMSPIDMVIRISWALTTN